jgi:hypothetical protein
MSFPYPRTAKPALIIGSVAIDRIATSVAQSGDILGGAATYASIAASYFAPTRLVGVVGADFPRRFMQRLRRHGIDLGGLQVDPSGKTFFWSGRYGENFDPARTWSRISTSSGSSRPPSRMRIRIVVM